MANGSIISRRGKVWLNKTSLTLFLLLLRRLYHTRKVNNLVYACKDSQFVSASTTMRFYYFYFYESVIFHIFYFIISTDSLNTFAHAFSYFIIYSLLTLCLAQVFNDFTLYKLLTCR